MNWKILTGIIIFVAIAIITGTFLFKEGGFLIPESKPKLEDINNVVEANNQFALDFYSQLKDKEGGNVFFSPYSISSALAMTYEGAKGETAQEIRSVFYFPEADDLRRTEYATIFNEINKKDKKYKLHIANALWAQKDYPFLDEYFKIVDEYYKGKVTNLDFKKNSESARVTINNWVEDQTSDKIKNLIPSGVIDTLTRLVLTNAIYFKGEWIKQFNKNNTRDQDFKISKSNVIKVPIMQRADDKAVFNYTENNKLQILEMPYSDGELSMLILLPKDDNLKALENSLSTKKLSKWKQDLKEQRVDIFIPKFKFETKYFMADALREMGMPTAFSDSADFSGMTGKQDLKISDVIHQAFIEVNEEGTEAAAATIGLMHTTGSGPEKEPKIPVFRADHPFIFLIQEKATGNILFLGRVVDPR